jgi:hypothetical protein
LPLASAGPDGDDDVAELLTALDLALGLDDVLEWVRAVQRYTFDGGQEARAPQWQVTGPPVSRTEPFSEMKRHS